MDSMLKIPAQPAESKSSDIAPTIGDAASSDDGSGQEFHSDLTPISSYESPVGHSAIECLPEVPVELDGKHLLRGRDGVVANGDHDPDLIKHDSANANGDLSEKFEIFVSKAPGDLSELNSDVVGKDLEGTRPSITVVRYGFEPHVGHEPPVDELGEELMRNMSIQEGHSPEDDSGAKAPPIVAWKDPAIDKSEIPANVLAPPISDVTDLGDREFYASLNARDRKSAALAASDHPDGNLALQDQFFEALVNPYEEKKGFFPRALLSTLVTEDIVFKELCKCLNDTHNQSQIKDYAERICNESPVLPVEDDNKPPKIMSFKKIFVILVLIEKTSSIIRFLEEGVSDLDLPLEKVQKGNNGVLFDLRQSKNKDKELECFRNWTHFSITSFEEWQWTAISPFFHKGSRKDVAHFLLLPSVKLPFTSDSRRGFGQGSEFLTDIEGGYGRVFKVDIHPDHHNFDLPEGQSFAIKRLNSKSKDDFKREVEILELFADTAHPHVISLLATYEQLGVYYLIFPWADSDLNKFWSVLKPKPSFDTKTIEWVAKQCEGIAQGLAKIHHYQTSNADNPLGSHEKRYGRHGDLKPENILWFSNDDGGLLKISDFGLYEYSTIHSKSYKSKSSVATSLSYRAPECVVKGGKIGQSYDIWTLGCLYLEFITWLLGGWELIKEFEKRRMSVDPIFWDMKTDTFFELVRYKDSVHVAAMVKSAVTDFMLRLHAHPRCTTFLHEFIKMIQHEMLIVKPNNREERGRISSEQVHANLSSMLKKFEDKDYAFEPAPWLEYARINEQAVELDITDSVAKMLPWESLRQYEGPIQVRAPATTT